MLRLVEVTRYGRDTYRTETELDAMELGHVSMPSLLHALDRGTYRSLTVEYFMRIVRDLQDTGRAQYGWSEYTLID